MFVDESRGKGKVVVYKYVSVGVSIAQVKSLIECSGVAAKVRVRVKCSGRA
ncbi:hypothetical protein IF1G_06568 [Cordyceps javanica]|uniref:Uncharacterized protein n=1 Tax=Cordyceps javanica TaxID=43265 RepID=A0A545UYP3_9HYPO|nr:hypothetical protein IF1G_06568 [Cordyceps javanica]